MNESHLRKLAAVLPNLEKAVFDRQDVSIGGGSFDPETALALALAARLAIRLDAGRHGVPMPS